MLPYGLCLDRSRKSESSHLQGALQGSECVHFLVDNRVLAASNERFPEVVVRERLLVAHQRDSSFLYVVQHHAHLIYLACWVGWGGAQDREAIKYKTEQVENHSGSDNFIDQIVLSLPGQYMQ